MKKSLAALGLLSALLPVAAQAAYASPSFSYSGAYGGLDLGFSSVTNSLEYGSTTIDQGTTGFAYGGFAGYGQQIDGPWYVGGELGIGNTTGSARLGGASVGSKETQDYMFTADLRGGRVIGENTLAYGKLGWGHTEFDQKFYTASSSTSNTQTFDGIRFGAGAETVLSGNWTGRLEAVYTDYGAQTVNNVKYSPDDVGVKFGVSYYFY